MDRQSVPTWASSLWTKLKEWSSKQLALKQTFLRRLHEPPSHHTKPTKNQNTNKKNPTREAFAASETEWDGHGTGEHEQRGNSPAGQAMRTRGRTDKSRQKEMAWHTIEEASFPHQKKTVKETSPISNPSMSNVASGTLLKAWKGAVLPSSVVHWHPCFWWRHCLRALRRLRTCDVERILPTPHRALNIFTFERLPIAAFAVPGPHLEIICLPFCPCLHLRFTSWTHPRTHIRPRTMLLFISCEHTKDSNQQQDNLLKVVFKRKGKGNNQSKAKDQVAPHHGSSSGTNQSASGSQVSQPRTQYEVDFNAEKEWYKHMPRLWMSCSLVQHKPSHASHVVSKYHLNKLHFSHNSCCVWDQHLL